MIAAFCTGKETIEVRQADDPTPAPGEVLLRVRACGICGTDLHFYNGQFPTQPSVSPGHEFSGEIAALGDGVTGWSVGDRAAVEPIRACRACAYCLSGRYHLCPRRALMGVPGALAEYVCVPAYTLYRLPEAVDYELGALAEPLAVAVHGLHIANLIAGEKVLVIGAGTIGLMSTLAANHAGADVVAVYRHDHQGEAALAAGASRVVRDGETAGLENEGFDLIVETVGGAAPTIAQALGIVRPGGRVSVLGVFTQPAQLNALALMLKEVTLVGGITYCHQGLRSDFETALGILAARAETARSLVSHRFPLAETGAAFAAAADKSSKSLKVQVHA